MTGGEVVTMIKDLCLAGAGVTTAIVAVKGLQSWRRQLRGKSEYDVARDLIKATYRLREVVKVYRSPVLWAEEFPNDGKADGEDWNGPSAYSHPSSARRRGATSRCPDESRRRSNRIPALTRPRSGSSGGDARLARRSCRCLRSRSALNTCKDGL
jgi:hypothetical protein